MAVQARPWSGPGPLIQSKKTHVEPYVWRWADIEPRVRRSAEFVVPGRDAERRIVRLANPGVPDRTSAQGRAWTAIPVFPFRAFFHT